MRKRIAIVGGGIAGLAAAVRLRDKAPADTEITIYEETGTLGGKLSTGELGGVPVERGPESFLYGGPGGESAVVTLARRLALGDDLIHPAPVPPALAIGGTLEPVPGGTLIGVPGDLTELGAVATADAGRDRDDGRPLLGPGQDIAVGALVRARFGDQVTDRMVDPMLGGVYAGRADELSLAVTIPALAATARIEHTLAGAVRAAQAKAVRVPGRPAFATIRGGLSRLVRAAATESGARVKLNTSVESLRATDSGWQLDEAFDAVVLAVPATPAARLLSNVDSMASTMVGVLKYASVALVGVALPAGTELPERSGFLVPATEGTMIKAATFMSRKWPALDADGRALVRMSVGRAGETENLSHDDDYLIEHALADLGRLTGTRLPAPLASWVQRWNDSLPQYAPGHLDRVATVRTALAEKPGIALAGAAYDGVGIPACVASGERAADLVVESLS